MTSDNPDSRTSTTEAGRRFYETLHRMGLAHAPNGTVGTEIAAIESEAVAEYRKELAAKVRALEPLYDDDGLAMPYAVFRKELLSLIEEGTSS